jgi:hypothetical protein
MVVASIAFDGLRAMTALGNGPRVMRHSEFKEWAEANLGDSRQVYARDRRRPDDAPLVYMPEGAAAAFYEDAKAGNLICPVPRCPSTELSTRGPASRRHHFFHLNAPPDAKHNREYERLVVQRLLRDWTARQSLSVAVWIDEEVGGVPVSLLVELTSGARVALCYVDQRLGAGDWLERHSTIAAYGIADSWLFAPRPMFLARPEPESGPSESEEGVVLDRPVFKKMRGNSTWPLIINAERQEVANLIRPGGRPAQRLGLPAPESPERVLHAVVSPLSRCRLTEYGIATPAIGPGVLALGRR